MREKVIFKFVLHSTFGVVQVFTLKTKQPLYPSWKLCSRGMTFLSRERCTEREAMADNNQQSSKKIRFEKQVELSG